jgi:transposase
MHALFVSQGITTMKRKDLATAERRAQALRLLTGLELAEGEHLAECLELYEARIVALEDAMKKESAGDEQIERLQTVPGVGPKVSFAFAAHVCAERFENAGQVSNYLGLVPRVYMSGDTVRYGRITKRGNGYLRALLVQAAWSIAWSKRGGKLKERYEYMTAVKGISKKKAVVAIARRLAELLYAIMRDGTEYEYRPFKREGKNLAQLALCA